MNVTFSGLWFQGWHQAFPAQRSRQMSWRAGLERKSTVWAVLVQLGCAGPWGSERYLGDALGKARACGLSFETTSSLSPASTRAACVSSVP